MRTAQNVHQHEEQLLLLDQVVLEPVKCNRLAEHEQVVGVRRIVDEDSGRHRHHARPEQLGDGVDDGDVEREQRVVDVAGQRLPGEDEERETAVQKLVHFGQPERLYEVLLVVRFDVLVQRPLLISCRVVDLQSLLRVIESCRGYLVRLETLA